MQTFRQVFFECRKRVWHLQSGSPTTHDGDVSEKRAAIAREPVRAQATKYFRPFTRYGQPLFYTTVYDGTQPRPVLASMTAFGHGYGYGSVSEKCHMSV